MENTAGQGRNEGGKDRGAITLEASVAVVLFLFTALLLFHFLHIHTVKTLIYEAAAEAAEYAAEMAYLESLAEDLTGGSDDGDDAEDPEANMDGNGLMYGALLVAAKTRFLSSIDDEGLIDRYVVGGKAGILLAGSEFPDENGDICLQVNYTICIESPILPTLTTGVEERIVQKPYLGHRDKDENEGDEAADPYVYVTDNQEVYHMSRSCTHLVLEIHAGTRESAVAGGYHACEYCGARGGEYVLICPEGEAYHYDANCRGLQRRVYRKRLSEVGGLPPCTRCGY